MTIDIFPKCLLWGGSLHHILCSYLFEYRPLVDDYRVPGNRCGTYPLHWRHNGHDSVSNHQPHDFFLNRLFRRRSNKISKLRVTGLCAWNSPETGEFPAQMASNAENVSIWWRHHVLRHHAYTFVLVALFRETQKYFCVFVYFSILRWRRYFNSFLMEDVHLCEANNMGADVFTTQGAMASATMLLT